MAEETSAIPYYKEEHYVGKVLVRETHADILRYPWMRFQAGYNTREQRGFAGPTTVFRLLAVGRTEKEVVEEAMRRM